MNADLDRSFMQSALSLGRRALGRVWPNPAVGCVIVKDGIVLGRGSTAHGGRPHAEPQALAQAGAGAKGSTVYVTLEPCAHHGQTGPCADALVQAQVGRVVVATTDPDPRVSGKGLDILKAAGIQVDLGVCKEDADHDHAGFFRRVSDGRPFVTLKLATSLDGQIATSTGDSQWITGLQARRMVHAMRARHDAVMVGAGTARADNPTLNVRDMGDVRQPVRIVVSKDLNIPIDGHLAQTARRQPVWLIHNQDADPREWLALGCQSYPVRLSDNRIDMAAALHALGAAGLTRVLCEGGGALSSSLLRAGLVDELALFQAGVAIGADGTPSLASMSIKELAKAARFKLSNFQVVGPDTFSIWRKEA